MKICYLCSDRGIPLEGSKGASAHVRSFVRALAIAGHEVTVLTSSADGHLGTGMEIVRIACPKFFEGIPLDENPRLVRALNHLWNNVAVEKALETYLGSQHPDLIYERNSPFAVAGSVLAAQHGIPHILEVNALLTQEGKEYRRQAFEEASEFLEGRALRRTSLIVAVSEMLREEIIRLQVPEEKILVVPNGVDPDLFDFKGSDHRKNFPSKIVLGFVGSLKPWHGIKFMAQVFRDVAEDPRFHLIVVGEGPLMKTLEELREDLPGRVTLLGGIPHEEVPQYIRTMDIALAPYPALERFYFSPLKVLEYMSCGRAVLATKIGQIPTFIRHHETGWLVEPEDRAGWVRAVRHLAKSPSLCSQLGQAAAQEIRKRHTWKHRAEEILNRFDRLKEDSSVSDIGVKEVLRHEPAR